MTITTRIGRRTFLSLLLLLATSTTQVVEAKVTTSGNFVLASTKRTLQDEGNNLDEVLEDHSGNNDSAEDVAYVPHASGTSVRFQDQDGTWMIGIIWKYNSGTETYTIRWNEDNVEEDFSDLEIVEQLVRNAEENEDEIGNFPINSREQQEENSSTNESGTDYYDGDVPDNFDFAFMYEYEDLSDYDPWPIGSPTLLEFADGWYEGAITSFSLSDDKKNVTYIVTWSDGAADSFSNELEWMDLMVANAEDYEPWEIGTPTFGYPNPDAVETSDGQKSENSFINGEITSFENGAYSVTWSNGDTKVYNNFDMVDRLVNNAAMHLDPSWVDSYNPYPKGTAVTWDFDDGWWEGTITDFSDGTYEVTWSDGSSKYYSNIPKINQMVSFATGKGFTGNLAEQEPEIQHTEPYAQYNDNIYGDYYDLETIVYARFEDGWWAGYIDSYEGDYYIVRWSDDSADRFLPGEDMDEMVINGQYIPKDYNIWNVGTHVYKDFDGTFYYGTIDYSEGGFYTVLWDDGSRTKYVSGSEIDEMVKNAYNSGMSPFGKVVLIIFALGCLGGILYFVLRRNNGKQELTSTNQVRGNELDLTEENEAQYADQQAQPGLV